MKRERVDEQRKLLLSVGLSLYGERWTVPLANALAAHHPNPLKQTLSPSYLRHMVNGRKACPGWLIPALGHVLDHEILTCSALRAQIQALRPNW